MRVLSSLLALAAVASAASFGRLMEETPHEKVERDGIVYNVFKDDDLGTKMEFVTNSGICETTKGVTQHSGYFTVGPNMHMFFWFFEARNKPETAPFASWFNGGPGCSSLIGLFQENGPCNFPHNQSDPVVNKYSWNEFANMIYIDQPIGVGFSYGRDSVSSTVTAAPFVWKLLQAFYKAFPKYKSRDYGLWTESYGGHYGPGFTDYIQSQNAAIKAGKVKGTTINLVALGINNGLTDGTITYKSYIDYAYKNKYNQIINENQYNSYMTQYNVACKPALALCTSTTSSAEDANCAAAERVCAQTIENSIISQKDFDVYDVRQPSDDPFPPTAYLAYLNRPAVQKAIGVNKKFQYCSTPAQLPFIATGDTARSFLPTLSRVVQTGITTVLWAGDADFICNYLGFFDTANAITYKDKAAFNAQSLAPYKVGGKEYGLFKTKSNLSWLQVYEAGHEVPYYQPEASLQVFKQTMSKKPLSST